MYLTTDISTIDFCDSGIPLTKLLTTGRTAWYENAILPKLRLHY